MPDFPGFPRIATRIFENPIGRAGVQKVEFAGFSRLFWMIGLRKRAEVELRRCAKINCLDRQAGARNPWISQSFPRSQPFVIEQVNFAQRLSLRLASSRAIRARNPGESTYSKNSTCHFTIQIYAITCDRNSSSRFAMAPAGDKGSIAYIVGSGDDAATRVPASESHRFQFAPSSTGSEFRGRGSELLNTRRGTGVVMSNVSDCQLLSPTRPSRPGAPVPWMTSRAPAARIPIAPPPAHAQGQRALWVGSATCRACAPAGFSVYLSPCDSAHGARRSHDARPSAPLPG